MSEIVRGTSVAIAGRGVLLRGAPGSGKSDLALRLVDRGALLISDDYTEVRAEGGQLLARAPGTIAGKIEMRGVAILDLPTASDIPICLLVDLDGTAERLPDAPGEARIAGAAIPALALAALEASAPLKVEAALRLHGLNP